MLLTPNSFNINIWAHEAFLAMDNSLTIHLDLNLTGDVTSNWLYFYSLLFRFYLFI